MTPVPEPHCPPRTPSRVPEASPQEPGNLVSRGGKGCLFLPTLTLAQVQPYLDSNHRNSGSLIAGFWATLDRELLEEAQAKYANSPEVNLVAYLSGQCDRQQAASSERRTLLERFKESDPENSLGNYLSACDYFKLGRIGPALKELEAAMRRTSFRDYSEEFIQNSEEVWQTAGYTKPQAKAVASASLRIAPLVEVKGLGERLASLAKAYEQAGEVASVRVAMRTAAILGKRLDQPSAAGLFRNLAGLRVESQVLSAVAPDTSYDGTGRTVTERLTQLAQRREALLLLGEQGVKAQQTSADSDLVSFYDQQKAFGSERALRWLVRRRGMADGLK